MDIDDDKDDVGIDTDIDININTYKLEQSETFYIDRYQIT